MRAAATTLRTIALYEALKGALALVVATGALSLVHRDVHALAIGLVEHAHLNPASHYPGIFVAAAAHLEDARLRWLALGAVAYSLLRGVEAYGLLKDRAWAAWLAAVSGAIYVPPEATEWLRRPTALGAALFAINLAVVAFMVRSLLDRRRRAAGSRGPGPA